MMREASSFISSLCLSVSCWVCNTSRYCSSSCCSRSSNSFRLAVVSWLLLSRSAWSCSFSSLIRSASCSSSTSFSWIWAWRRSISISSCSRLRRAAYCSWTSLDISLASCSASSLMTAWVLICFARSANRSATSVCVESTSVGLAVTKRIVRALPPRDSFSSFVSAESRNGIWRWGFLARSTMASMQLPRFSSDLLMAQVCVKLRPSTLESFTRSLPAKSTSEILLARVLSGVTCLTWISNSAWARLEESFSSCAAVTRWACPRWTSCAMPL
mmetsp:Transcript_65560/g.109209  ORF Transcript_65560/g.109209 Transcript_65560/m.109209 type:complete len:272 (-) Transcript_65560:775-1590(-)